LFNVSTKSLGTPQYCTTPLGVAKSTFSQIPGSSTSDRTWFPCSSYKRIVFTTTPL